MLEARFNGGEPERCQQRPHLINSNVMAHSAVCHTCAAAHAVWADSPSFYGILAEANTNRNNTFMFRAGWGGMKYRWVTWHGILHFFYVMGHPAYLWTSTTLNATTDMHEHTPLNSRDQDVNLSIFRLHKQSVHEGAATESPSDLYNVPMQSYLLHIQHS